MRAAELEADRAPELDELLLAELVVQPRPQLVGRGVGVPDDRIRPLERCALAPGIPLDLNSVRVGDVREAELLQAAVDEAVLEHAALDEAPRLGCTLVQRERVGGTDPRHDAVLSPPRPSAGSSWWPTFQVLMTRCCP